MVPIIVEFPLRGEWLAPNTPGKKVPSHGTNQLGTRYAYDFIQVDWERRGWPSYCVSLPHYLLFGVPLHKYYCWGQEIHAPCNGIIVHAYAALVHLQTGSIQVSVGQHIKKGEVIGRVGHSGNSFSPHLHFQLMDSSDILTANGLPCAFEQYELFKDGKWQKVFNGIPTDKDRIRFHS